MKNLSNVRILMWVFALAPLALTAALYNRLPEMIPMHWSVSGYVRHDPRVNIWWLAGISPILAVVAMVLPKIDPRKANYEKFREYHDGFWLFIMLFMLGIVGIVLSESLNPGMLRIEFVVTLAVGFMFAVVGNIMPKLKNNFFMGIRTPWTLSSPEVWHKTHRLGGAIWFFGGLAIIASSFFLSDAAMFIALLAIVAVISIIPAVMSYVWYRKLTGGDE